MTMMFRPVPETEDYNLHVSCSIAGSSGTGKTYSACLLAKGLTGGEPFAFIDTENKRALHYKSDFPMMKHFNFGPDVDGVMVGFPPERWIALLDQIEKDGFKAVVIDSFSHAWEGIDGVLELQAHEVEAMAGGDSRKAERVGQLAWAKIKPRYRRLIERIVQAKMDVILCIRAKPVMQERGGGNARPTKLRRTDIPWDIASDRDLIFEMTASMILEPERPGQPVILKCPDHFRGLFTGADRIAEEAGIKMRDWAASGGQDREAKELLDRAEAAARKGRGKLQDFWSGLDQAQRATVNTNMERYKSLANEAEQRLSDNLFEDDGTSELQTSLSDLIAKELAAAKTTEDVDAIEETYKAQIRELAATDAPAASQVASAIMQRTGELAAA